MRILVLILLSLSSSIVCLGGDHDEKFWGDALLAYEADHSNAHEHVGAHEHADANGHAHADAHEHADANGHGHADAHGHAGGHAHDDSFYLDLILPYESHGRGESGAHGHSGHTSIEGYPFLHGIRTEIDFVERALEMDLVHTRGADNGTVDEWEFEAELVWAMNSRAIFILGVPLISLDPDVGSNTAGYGDLELGFQFLAFGGERDLFFTALFMSVPTGDPDRDLGAGHSVLEPTALWLHDFGGGNYFQSRIAWELPVSIKDVGNDFRYDMGLFHTFLCTEHWRMLRYLTPILEVNGVTALNGDDSSQTIVDLTSGVRWVVRELDEVGIGGSFPVTGRENFDWQLLLSYRLHF